jgi:hypothetical protein
MISPFIQAAEKAGAKLHRGPREVKGVVKQRWVVLDAPPDSELWKASYPTRRAAAKAFCTLHNIEVDPNG